MTCERGERFWLGGSKIGSGLTATRARRRSRSEGVELLKRTKKADVCRVARRQLFWLTSVGVADADAFICDWTLREAIQLAGTGAKMILPHNTVCRMAREQSRRVLRWNPANPLSGKLYRSQRARAWPGLAACGWSMPIWSRVTAWTSGSKVGDARTPSS